MIVNNEAIHISNIKPITLTEKRLIEFGFTEYKVIVNNSCDGFEVEVEYAHQLQNLYYSLTNKEL